MVGFDLPEMVDNHAHKVVSSVNALIGGNLFFLELCLKVPSSEGAITKLTPTEHQLAQQRSEFMTSLVYVSMHMNTVAMEFCGD